MGKEQVEKSRERSSRKLRSPVVRGVPGVGAVVRQHHRTACQAPRAYAICPVAAAHLVHVCDHRSAAVRGLAAPTRRRCLRRPRPQLRRLPAVLQAVAAAVEGAGAGQLFGQPPGGGCGRAGRQAVQGGPGIARQQQHAAMTRIGHQLRPGEARRNEACERARHTVKRGKAGRVQRVEHVGIASGFEQTRATRGEALLVCSKATLRRRGLKACMPVRADRRPGAACLPNSRSPYGIRYSALAHLGHLHAVAAVGHPAAELEPHHIAASHQAAGDAHAHAEAPAAHRAVGRVSVRVIVLRGAPA